MFEEMNRVIAEKKIRPVLDRTFPLTDAAAAFRHLESGAHFGKVVLSF